MDYNSITLLRLLMNEQWKMHKWHRESKDRMIKISVIFNIPRNKNYFRITVFEMWLHGRMLTILWEKKKLEYLAHVMRNEDRYSLITNTRESNGHKKTRKEKNLMVVEVKNLVWEVSRTISSCYNKVIITNIRNG